MPDHVISCHASLSNQVRLQLTVSRRFSPEVPLSLPATLWLVVAPAEIYNNINTVSLMFDLTIIML